MVLLVDLLATGGIGLPSVAGTFWLLLALGLQGQPPRALRPVGAWVGLLAAIALAVACYRTAYSPVLGCQAQLRLAEREPARAVEHLEAAAAADPWAAEPWRQLAAVEFERWWQQPSQDAFDQFQRASAKALELAPNSAPAWLTAGDWYFRASSKTDREGKKVAAEALGVRCRPTSRRCGCIPTVRCIGPNWPRPAGRPATGRDSAARPRLPCGWTTSPLTARRRSRPMCATASNTASAASRDG